ncbi:major facilitator superfamily domain-containing protein [Tribonema minus]|uniref:Major facilitator superfamily domain-containing protein n=1 Tax=Tribonema minus TaxID=303371 RepID=A0A835YNN7_9STRA|nr:major facilitator superfamily domain-containing protein [Tribonema minus]
MATADVESLLPQQQKSASYGATEAKKLDETPDAASQKGGGCLGLDKGLLAIMGVVLIGDMARGLMFPTLSSYVKLMGGSHAIQGFCVAGFSFGRVISSPILGRASIVHGYKKVLTCSCATIALGALLYSLANSTPMLLVAQIVMGLGSGTLGVTRAYVADHAPIHNRTAMLAMLTAVQYTGFTVTPVLGSLLCTLVGEDETPPKNALLWGQMRWEWNQFTAPGPIMAGACALALLAVVTLLDDAPPRTPPKKKAPLDHPPAEGGGGGGAHADEEPMSAALRAAILACFLLNVATKGTIACYETLGASYAVSALGLSHGNIGAFFAAFGALGVAALVSMRWLCRVFNDVQLIVGGVAVMLASTALLLDAGAPGRAGDIAFVVSIFLQYSVGYPIGHTSVLGLFSKVVGKRPQGTLQGLFASAGSVARIAFPILAGVIAELSSEHVVFAVLCVVLTTTILAVVAYRNTFLQYCREVAS